MKNLFAQALRMTRRDWRAGELRLLLAALLVAVAAVTSVGFFVDRMRAGLERDAAQLFGGDLSVAGDQPLPESFGAEARARGLAVAQTVVFPSMAMQAGDVAAGDEPRAQLSGLKAVSVGYPLRGAVRVTGDAAAPDAPATGIPSPGTVWIDAQLVAALGTRVGDALKLGDRMFRVERLITLEPDRGVGFINFAPRVMLRLDELPGTGLIQPGARATYRLLAAGTPAQVESYQRWLRPRLARGQRLATLASESGDGGRPEMNQTLSRAQSFLSLVALLTVLLAAVAVALATRRYVQRHVDACAVMRCLGSGSGEVTALFCAEFVAIGVAASALGSAIGFAAHFVLLEWLGSLVQTNLPPAGFMPALQGFVTGLVLLIGFALPPLLQLRRVPPLRVLRRELGPPDVSAALTYGLGLAAFLGLIFWFAGSPTLGAVAGGGFVGGFLAFAAVSYALLRALAPLRERLAGFSVALRFAFAAALRRPGATVVQVVALAVGLMALLLLTMTRTDLIDGWRGAAPADAPNRFVINIQPEQRAPFNAALARNGLPAQALLPMVRGRLVAVNGRPVAPDALEGRARRLVDREFNLSYMDAAPDYNAIVEGRWFAPDADEISVEEGLMKDLRLALGDRLRFDVAGEQVEARIGSVRRVEWNSFKVNFFVIFPTRMLEPMQQSFITSFRMPDGHDIGPRLLAEFPNLTVVDTGAILRQVQAVLDQVVSAVEFLFLFALGAGVLVLYAALVATRDERLREAGLLRALGASRRQLARAQLAEFAFVGGLAGLLAGLGANAIGWALAVHVLDFRLAFNGWAVLGGMAAGAALAAFGGWLGLRDVLRRPPLHTLRDA